MIAAAPDMKFTRIANWFGSDAMVRDLIGEKLRGRPMVVIPFAGSMSILPVIDAAKIIANDLHRHVMNLAMVMQRGDLKDELRRRLDETPFHPDSLASAQAFCKQIDAACSASAGEGLFLSPPRGDAIPQMPDLDWAVAYFICTWMTRGGNSGVTGEFDQALPVRYSPNGGGSGQRFFNAAASIDAWHKLLQRCELTCADAFDVIDATHDSPRVSLYSDSPWVTAGVKYVHSFDEAKHRRLAKSLSRFKQTRVVVRYDDHPLIRELYPRDRWEWEVRESRSQTNDGVAEVLLVNKGNQG